MLTIQDHIFLNSLLEEAGDVKVEYQFYKGMLGIIDDNLSELQNDDIYIFREHKIDFLKKIIMEDDLYWDIYEMLENKARQFVNDLKQRRNEK